MTPETAPETTLETVSADYPASPQAFSAISAPRLTPPSIRRRLPRFLRAKRSHRPPLALQGRDLDLLRTAHEYRLISTPQFLRLFVDESRDGIYRRLQKLFHAGYLDRIGNNPNAPLVYQLGRRGADVLEVPRRKEVGERYVLHQLMIGDFRIALTVAARQRGILLRWHVISQDLPIKPDGFFTLQFSGLSDGRNRAHFFLEADRSTMPRERFVAKLEAYARWHASGGHTEMLGIKNFRVLTVTKSDERVASLVAASITAEALRQALPLFWFTSEKRLGAGGSASVFDSVWEIPGRETRESILP